MPSGLPPDMLEDDIKCHWYTETSTHNILKPCTLLSSQGCQILNEKWYYYINMGLCMHGVYMEAYIINCNYIMMKFWKLEEGKKWN